MGVSIIPNYPLFQISILSLFFIKNHFLTFERSRRLQNSIEVEAQASLDGFANSCCGMPVTLRGSKLRVASPLGEGL